MDVQARVESLNIGRIKLLEGHSKEELSAIVKQPTEEVLFLSPTHLTGDEQADTVHHGGTDKAVCVYSYVHYPYWEEQLGRNFLPGAFGENVTIHSLTESDVRIGDTFRWGEAILQVSQPRKPCYKLAVRHQVPKLALYVEQTGFSGYYLRVCKTGHVSKSDPMILVERDLHNVTVADANQIMFHGKQDVQGIQRLLDVPALSASWRQPLLSRLEKLGQ